jgi:hypothetical protein
VWKSSITVLVAYAGACMAIALTSDRPADPPPRAPTDGLVVEAPPEVLAIDERWAKKQRLIDRLIAGDLRLAEAAEAVIALNRDWPPLLPERYEAYPGRSLDARVAHMLVGAVELRLAADDPRRDEILGRLAGELGDVTAAHGRSASD